MQYYIFTNFKTVILFKKILFIFNIKLMIKYFHYETNLIVLCGSLMREFNYRFF